MSQIKTILTEIRDAHNTMAELSKGYFLRERKTVLPSVERKKWNYVPIEDCLYSIALYSIEGAAEVLSKDPATRNKIIEIILQECDKYMSKNDDLSLRTAITDVIAPEVAKRFSVINKKEHNIIPEKNHVLPVNLHKYLRGGHITVVKKNNLNSLRDKEFGLIKVV